MSEQASQDAAMQRLQEQGLVDDPQFLPYDPADLDRSKASEDLLGLLDQVDRDIVGWKPNPGDKVYGKLVDITEGESEWGPYPLLVIETPSGRLVGVHAFHTVLKKEVERKIARGTMHIGVGIAIAYRGEGNARGGNNAPNMYRIAISPVAK